MTAPPAAGVPVGALGCTRDGYRLIGVARLAWVLMSLVFVVPPDAVLLYRLYELASFPLGLVTHVLLPIGFCALALAPAGPLWRWVRNLAVALLLVDLAAPFLRSLPPLEDNPILAPLLGRVIEVAAHPALDWAEVLPSLALAVGSVAFCLRLRLVGPAVGWALMLAAVLGAGGATRLLDFEQFVRAQSALNTLWGVAGLLNLALPFWTARALGPYIRSSSKQIA